MEFVSRQGEYSVWYTDGSKSTEGSESRSFGSACHSPGEGVSVTRSIDKRAPIFTAESIAILDAVRTGTRNVGRNILIFSDSLSALSSLKSFKFDVRTGPYILETKKEVYLFEENPGDRFRVKFYSVPTHIGLCGNESADSLTRGATKGEPDLSVDIPYTDLNQSARSATFSSTCKHIRELSASNGVHYTKAYLNERHRTWFHGLNLSSKVITTISRCRVGHYSLAASLARIGIVDSPLCISNMGDQDLDHVLWQCPLFDKQRTELVREQIKIRVYPPNTSLVILHDPT